MSIDEINEVSFQIIMSAGEARSIAMEALSLAKKGDIEAASKSLDEARIEIYKAHEYQTSLLNLETNGKKDMINILLIHSQDHLMNAMTVLDLTEEFISLYELVFNK